MRPFWRYYGGKYRLAPRYPRPIPGLPIVEPFAGAAGYSTRFGGFREVLLIDRSPVISGIWAWLIDATPDDVLSIGDIPDGGTVDDLDAPKAARDLAGFWVNGGTSSPRRTPSKWARRGDAVHNWAGWGPKARQRIASQLDAVRLWRVYCGEYASAPDIDATWFVDPPYATPAGRHYPHDFDDFDALGRWCQSRRGRVIVCEQAPSDWLPFWPLCDAKTARANRSAEVVWHNAPRQGALALDPASRSLLGTKDHNPAK